MADETTSLENCCLGLLGSARSRQRADSLFTRMARL